MAERETHLAEAINFSFARALDEWREAPLSVNSEKINSLLAVAERSRTGVVLKVDKQILKYHGEETTYGTLHRLDDDILKMYGRITKSSVVFEIPFDREHEIPASERLTFSVNGFLYLFNVVHCGRVLGKIYPPHVKSIRLKDK